MMNLNEYRSLDGVGLSETIAAGKTTPRAALEAAWECYSTANPKLNAVVIEWIERARGMADRLPTKPTSRVHGVPMLLKNLFAAMSGTIETLGSRFLDGNICEYTAPHVSRMLYGGLVPFGRTNTPEFGLGHSTEPLMYGPTRNPHELSRSSGASSGGAGAAVSCGIVPIAHGNDGGGSIRLPAACCGIFGLKPSYKLTPSDQSLLGVSEAFIHDHVLTRSVRDSAAVLDLLSGSGDTYFNACKERPCGLRIAYWDKSPIGTELDPEVAQAIEAKLSLFEQFGTVVRARPDFDGERMHRAYLQNVFASSSLAIRQIAVSKGTPIRRLTDQLEAFNELIYVHGARLSYHAIHEARRIMAEEVARLNAWSDQFDLVLTAAIATPPKKIGELGSSAEMNEMLRYMTQMDTFGLMDGDPFSERTRATLAYCPFLIVQNVTGEPAASVPLVEVGGLPVGLQVVAARGRDSLLLAVASALEPHFTKLDGLFDKLSN